MSLTTLGHTARLYLTGKKSKVALYKNKSDMEESGGANPTEAKVQAC